MQRFAASLILLCAALPASAEYRDGLVAYEEARFHAALGEFRAIAHTGHAGAEFMLGVMHFNGFGVARDEAVAAIYFRQAAEQGEPGAQLAFGSLHIRGVGVFQNLVEARKWLGICSRSGEPELARQATALMNVTSSLMTPAEITRADQRAERWRPARPGLVRPR